MAAKKEDKKEIKNDERIKLDATKLRQLLARFSRTNPQMADLVFNGASQFLGINGQTIMQMTPSMMEFLLDLGVITRVKNTLGDTVMLNS